MKLYSAEQVRELDRLAIEVHGIPGLTLMRRAASACVRETLARYPQVRTITVVCGSGNNAGDGYIVAGLLAEKNIEVQVLIAGDPSGLTADGQSAYQFCLQSTAVLVDADAPITGEVLIDALLGIGLSGDVRDHYASVIRAMNATHRPVVAVDIPSGLCADTGRVLGDAVVATITVTFIGAKRGLYTHEGCDHAGLVVLDELGVPDAVFDDINDTVEVLSLQRLPRRRRNSHKASFGHVLIIGGDQGMGGAVAMAAEAALRCGAGIVSVATRQENVSVVLAHRPELMVRGITETSELQSLIPRVSNIVIGPGLGQGTWSQSLFQFALESGLPLVVDADALRLLANKAEHRDNWILTPHPGEASALLGNDVVKKDRFAAVKAMQQTFGGAVLLKGAGTVITDGQRTSLCSFGNPGMATAGMGDVLSGIIGGLCAQGLDSYSATTMGVVLHAKAGDLAAARSGERGLVATDIIPIVRALINDLAS